MYVQGFNFWIWVHASVNAVGLYAVYMQSVLIYVNACLLDLPGAVHTMFGQCDGFERLTLLAYGQEIQLTWFSLH